MSYTGPETGGVLIDGLKPVQWALQVFLPPLIPSILGQAVAIFVCYWEFVVLFPSEVKIWRRLYRQRHAFRWQFAPLMTLFMRYFLLIYASAAAWAQYSTTMTNRACVADSVVFIIAVLVLNTSSIISMAWRSHAVARGVIETTTVLRIVQGVLFVMMLAAIGGVWWSMVQAQLVGSWLSRAEAGICVSDYSFVPEATDLVHEPNFWYYILSIFFDFTCMVTICISLKKLSKRSTGFSKLITQLFYHSLGYFIIIFLLFLLGIIWLRVQNAFWAANFIQMIQASIVIRILISEQNRAQKPHDTSYWDEAGYPGDRTSQQQYQQRPHGMTTYDSRYASDSRFAGAASGADRSSTQGVSRIGDVEEGDYELKATAAAADGYAHDRDHRGVVRPRQPRRYDSDFGGSTSLPPSEAGQSEMQASSKTAHSERSLGTTDDAKAESPVVTVEPLSR